MYKSKFKTTVLAANCCFILFSFMGISEAIEIITMEPMYGSIDSDFGHAVYLETDSPYYVVEWYVDGEWAWSSIGGAEGEGPTQATFYTGWISGSVTGTSHTVKAVAWPQGNADPEFSDSDSYTFYIFQPIIVEKEGKKTGVEATLEVNRHYYRHPWVYADLTATVI